MLVRVAFIIGDHCSEKCNNNNNRNGTTSDLNTNSNRFRPVVFIIIAYIQHSHVTLGNPPCGFKSGRLRILSQNAPVGGRKKILGATPGESAGHSVSEDGGTSPPGVEALGHVSMNDAVDHALSPPTAVTHARALTPPPSPRRHPPRNPRSCCRGPGSAAARPRSGRSRASPGPARAGGTPSTRSAPTPSGRRRC